MRPGGSKSKGNAFERLVATTIRKDLEEFGIDAKDIFRTPGSGGHPYCDDCDLMISDRLLPVIPFVVECKHEKQLTVGGLFDHRRDFQKHLNQVLKATAISITNGMGGVKINVAPLLLWQGNMTRIYAATYPSVIISVYGKRLPKTMTRLHFTHEAIQWVMFAFDDFRKLIVEKAKQTF